MFKSSNKSPEFCTNDTFETSVDLNTFFDDEENLHHQKMLVNFENKESFRDDCPRINLDMLLGLASLVESEVEEI